MKKIIIVLSILISLLLWKETINNNMIRFRIIANSNQKIDQEIKMRIVYALKDDLSHKSKTLEEERYFIQNRLPSMKQKLDVLLDSNYTIEYGDNYFPEKQYKNTIYPEGNYESLVITLGEGKGDNFWCILFPPLCMIDEEENIEYDSILKKVWNKFF